jgi:hypothetical protein
VLTAESLLKELKPVKRKWYIIGVKLDIPPRQLNIIKMEGKGSTDKCLTSMCEQWVLSQEATWHKVVDVLKSTIVDERELSDTLEQEYCWTESPNSKTWVR